MAEGASQRGEDNSDKAVNAMGGGPRKHKCVEESPSPSALVGGLSGRGPTGPMVGGASQEGKDNSDKAGNVIGGDRGVNKCSEDSPSSSAPVGELTGRGPHGPDGGRSTSEGQRRQG